MAAATAMAGLYSCPCSSNVRTFEWCGQKWSVKHSPVEKIGPGPSTFHLRNVELEADSSLRLWVRKVSDVEGTSRTVSSAEIQTVFPLGYGLYQVDLFGLLVGERWNHLVFGFFTFDLDVLTEHNKEIDIEIGTFNGRHGTGGVFSNQNNTNDRQQLLDISPSKSSTKHRLSIDWKPTSITWSLINLENGIILNKLTSSTSVPSCDGACFFMNLWQFNNIPPQGNEHSIILKHFIHTPMENYQQQELQFVHSLYFKGGRMKFLKGKKYRHQQIFLKAERRMTNVRLLIDQSGNDIEVEYPRGQDYVMLHRGVDIQGGQTDVATATLVFLDEQKSALSVIINCDQFRSPVIYTLPVCITNH